MRFVPLRLPSILILLRSLSTSAPIAPPIQGPRYKPPAPPPLPPISPSDLLPLGAPTPWRPYDQGPKALTTTPNPSLPFPTYPYPHEANGPQIFPWPIFQLSADDTVHHAYAYRDKGRCAGVPVVQIHGLPKAITSLGSFRSGPSNANSDVTSANYEGGAGRGYGRSSACIVFDYGGWSAGSIALVRGSTGTPRAEAALWNTEGCEGRPDDWVSMKPSRVFTCVSNRAGKWRSMRVWYGSERLTEDEFGYGMISLRQKMEEQNNGG